ncbi:MAG: hypothetical protein ACP5O7_08915, partial [Phycisphaerae bacterium]
MNRKYCGLGRWIAQRHDSVVIRPSRPAVNFTLGRISANPMGVLLQSELDKGAFGVKDTMAPFLGIR